MKMSPPWISYFNQLKALFEKDLDVVIEYNEKEEENSITLGVQGQDKADALSALLPTEKKFGNVTVKIYVVPANKQHDTISLFKEAFKGNKAVEDIVTISDIPGMTLTNPITYMIFKKEVVQYYDDNLGDAHGNRTTLYEQIANQVFENRDGIYFCTDNK